MLTEAKTLKTAKSSSKYNEVRYDGKKTPDNSHCFKSEYLNSLKGHQLKQHNVITMESSAKINKVHQLGDAQARFMATTTTASGSSAPSFNGVGILKKPTATMPEKAQNKGCVTERIHADLVATNKKGRKKSDVYSDAMYYP